MGAVRVEARSTTTEEDEEEDEEPPEVACSWLVLPEKCVWRLRRGRPSSHLFTCCANLCAREREGEGGRVKPRRQVGRLERRERTCLTRVD